MEEKGQPLTLILSVALIFGFVLGALSGYRMSLPLLLLKQGVPYTTIGIYHVVISLIRTVINPVLIIISFYLVGRKIDLKANLSRLILSLVLGAYVGTLAWSNHNGSKFSRFVPPSLLRRLHSPSHSVHRER